MPYAFMCNHKCKFHVLFTLSQISPITEYNAWWWQESVTNEQHYSNCYQSLQLEGAEFAGDSIGGEFLNSAHVKSLRAEHRSKCNSSCTDSSTAMH
jgi:hypothetical protein